MKTLNDAHADLLAAYRRLEQAQAQLMAAQQIVRDCEFAKARCEAIVALLSQETA